MALSIYPREDRILVKKDKFAEDKSSKIHLSEKARKELKKDEKGLRTETGIVVAVGEGRYANDGNLIPMDIKKHERVVFDSRAGIKITDIPDDVYIMRSSEILAVLRDKSESDK